MNNPNPECSREDCQFAYGGGSTTLAYYQPIYDKNGANTNPDRNTTTFEVSCGSCGRMWVGKSRMDETTYEELECKEMTENHTIVINLENARIGCPYCDEWQPFFGTRGGDTQSLCDILLKDHLKQLENEK